MKNKITMLIAVVLVTGIISLPVYATNTDTNTSTETSYGDDLNISDTYGHTGNSGTSGIYDSRLNEPDIKEYSKEELGLEKKKTTPNSNPTQNSSQTQSIKSNQGAPIFDGKTNPNLNNQTNPDIQNTGENNITNIDSNTNSNQKDSIANPDLNTHNNQFDNNTQISNPQNQTVSPTQPKTESLTSAIDNNLNRNSAPVKYLPYEEERALTAQDFEAIAERDPYYINEFPTGTASENLTVEEQLNNSNRKKYKAAKYGETMREQGLLEYNRRMNENQDVLLKDVHTKMYTGVYDLNGNPISMSDIVIQEQAVGKPVPIQKYKYVDSDLPAFNIILVSMAMLVGIFFAVGKIGESYNKEVLKEKRMDNIISLSNQGMTTQYVSLDKPEYQIKK